MNDQFENDQSDLTKAFVDEESNVASSRFSLPENWKYEATVSEIEAIIHRIEMGDLELAQVFEQFALAVQQLRQCEAFLNHQQQQVDLLIETLSDDAEAF